MIYFANPSTEPIRNAIRDGYIGVISTPKSTRESQRIEGAHWIADNGCFGADFQVDNWWCWLQAQVNYADSCQFATAPDVVGNHRATLARSLPWLPRIRNLGFRAAFVAQDGATPDNMPWDDCDAVFIGGTDNFKLGDTARAVIAAAKNRNLWVHIGRVNSGRRYRAFAYPFHYEGQLVPGADSCDGTFLIFGPDVNLPKLLRWIDDYKSAPALFSTEGHK